MRPSSLSRALPHNAFTAQSLKEGFPVIPCPPVDHISGPTNPETVLRFAFPPHVKTWTTTKTNSKKGKKQRDRVPAPAFSHCLPPMPVVRILALIPGCRSSTGEVGHHVVCGLDVEHQIGALQGEAFLHLAVLSCIPLEVPLAHVEYDRVRVTQRRWDSAGSRPGNPTCCRTTTTLKSRRWNPAAMSSFRLCGEAVNARLSRNGDKVASADGERRDVIAWHAKALIGPGAQRASDMVALAALLGRPAPQLRGDHPRQ